ncbi:MAG: GtrA family protein [Bacteroidales bacterium]|nr:GtrA family protein [Bacteroidales bacterium]
MIKEFLHRYFEPQFIRFVLVAILNTAFGWCVYAGLLWVINLFHIPNPYVLASLLGYIIGILFNFTTYSKIVFKNDKKRLLFRFIMVYVVCWLCNSFGIWLLEKWHINNYLAGAITAIPVGFLGYVLNSIFVFKKKPKFLNLDRKKKTEEPEQ